MAGSATPTSSAGHATRGPPTNPELTLTPDHSSGADHKKPIDRERLKERWLSTQELSGGPYRLGAIALLGQEVTAFQQHGP